MEENSQQINRRVVSSMKPFFPEEDIKELSEGFAAILRSGKLTLGRFTEEFEESFARYIGVKHAVAANSGTCTLEMIYRAIGIEGKEVITPTNTHISTSNTVLYAGGRPVLADIEADSLCMNVDDAFRKVTDKTKAMVVVHISGLIHPKIAEIKERCSDSGIILIEDAAHAHGATIDGKKAGSLSEAGSFSFYPAKVITTFEGGMLTTNNDEIASIARELRNHGTDSTGLSVRLGYNWRMSEVHALVGLIQLRRIEEIIERKNRIARIYDSSLSDEKSVSLIKVPINTRHSYYKYPVILSDKLNVEDVRNKLNTKYGIETGTVYYPPCHLQPAYTKLFGDGTGTLPISEDVLKRTVTLPIYAGMEEEDANYVAESLLSLIHEY